MNQKEKILEEIEDLIKKYGSDLEIDRYILKYLSQEELQTIKEKLIKKQDSVIDDNHEWLEQFKKYL